MTKMELKEKGTYILSLIHIPEYKNVVSSREK